MTPRLVALYEGADYARMARVLSYTAAQHCAHWDRQIEAVTMFGAKELSIEERVRRGSGKLQRWIDAVNAAPDGTPIALLDCDVMILRSLDDLWDRSFDVAYTARDPHRTKLPLNAGVVFVRATDAARRFLSAWLTATVPIRNNPKRAAQARKQYGAYDQAGMAATLKNPAATAGVAILALPCREWNCEDSEWGRFDPATRIVHVKGALRKAIFGQPISQGRKPSVLPLARQWKAFEAQA